jgi:tRNA G26 N,N-dimethylase Trm1
MGVKVSGAGYRSHRAAQEAGNSALDKLLNDLSREAETNG